MKSAIVEAPGQVPVYGDFPPPVPEADEQHIRVSASALSPLTRARASGTHYSSSGRFPFVAGVDGTGRLDNGQRVYFILPRAPYGGLAEETVVPAAQCLPLPDDLNDITAAAIANPGMSSWAALTERAHFQPGETVLINGATGASGRLAVTIARYMGAAKVIATGRDVETLNTLGADVTIPLTADGTSLESRFAEQFAERVDVVLDYLWGMSAERLLIAGAKAGPEGVPIRFIQIGTASGADITLPGAALRSSAIELKGSGIGSVSLERLLASVDGVLKAASAAGLHLPVQQRPLADVQAVWTSSDQARTVFTVP
jgi:NADPH:quinone reductase-like Zn-dependent oxidoreductase